MSAKNLRIVFMGTPEFAVASLKALVEHGYNIVGVITAPDKPAGRGQQLHESDIKKYAVEHGLKILQPIHLKDESFIGELKALNADLQIVVAFRMLPEIVWNMPALGTFNLHASLLPQYRGAAPINWAIINGEKETGVTTFFLKHEIDTGDIILQEKEAILSDDTAGSLYTRLMHKGAELVVRTVCKIQEGNYTLTSQHDDTPTIKEAPKLYKSDGEMDWNASAEEVHNRVRGLCPYPVAFTFLHGKQFRIFKTSITDKPADNHSPGEISSDGKTYFHMACNDYWISLKEVQLEGKKRLPIADFLRGYNPTPI